MSAITFSKQQTLQAFLIPVHGKTEGPFAERVHRIPGITNDLVAKKSQAGLTRFIQENLAEFEAVSKAEKEARRVLAVLQNGNKEDLDLSETDVCSLKEDELTMQLTNIHTLMQEMRTNLNSTLYELNKMQGKAGYFSWMSYNFFDPALAEYRKNYLNVSIDATVRSPNLGVSSPSSKASSPRSTLAPPPSPASNGDQSDPSVHRGVVRSNYSTSDLTNQASGCSRTPFKEEDESTKACNVNVSSATKEQTAKESHDAPGEAAKSQSAQEEPDSVKVDGDGAQVIALNAFIDTPRPPQTQDPLDKATKALDRKPAAQCKNSKPKPPTEFPVGMTIRRRSATKIPPPPNSAPPAKE